MPSLLDTLLAKSQAGDPEAIALLASLQGSGGALTAGAAPQAPQASQASQASQAASGDPQTNALLAGLPGMGGGPGSLESLRKPIIDPETGRSDIPTGPTGEIVQRSTILPIGVNDRGELRPASPSLIRNAIKGAPDAIVQAAQDTAEGVRYAGDIAAGRKDLWDPQTGDVSDEGVEWGTKRAAGLWGAGVPMPVPGAGVILGAGPVRRTAVKNLGLGREAMETEAKAAARFPHYAEQYPPTVPGVMKSDPKTGKTWLAKENSPEALDFAKERQRIQGDLNKNGFEPYFDPSKREYVDPKSSPAYAPNQNTLDIRAKKPETVAQDLAQFGSPEARANLQAGYQRGTEMPETKDWYAVKQLEDAFTKELGPEAGKKAFADKFAASMAATTGGAAPQDNLLMAQYGNYLREKGLPYPSGAHEMPFPIGGRYASGNIDMHKKIMDAGGASALGAGGDLPKRHNFMQNFMGNRNVATMDEQMTGGMIPGMTMPPKGKYGIFEQVAAEEAAKRGVPPANFQDVTWSGLKNLKDPSYTSGEPMIQSINEVIERTHRLTGMPKDEIVRRGLVNSEIPLYSQGGSPFSLIDLLNQGGLSTPPEQSPLGR